MASLVAQSVKTPPGMQETQLQSLGQEDLPEKEMATHSSIFAWKSHGRRGLMGHGPWGCKEQDMTEALSAHVRECWVTSRESGGKAVPGTPLRWTGNGGWQRKAGDLSLQLKVCVSFSFLAINISQEPASLVPVSLVLGRFPAPQFFRINEGHKVCFPAASSWQSGHSVRSWPCKPWGLVGNLIWGS